MVEASAESASSHAQKVLVCVRDASEMHSKKSHSEGCKAEGSCFVKAEGSLKAEIVLVGAYYVVQHQWGVQVLPVCSIQAEPAKSKPPYKFICVLCFLCDYPSCF